MVHSLNFVRVGIVALALTARAATAQAPDSVRRAPGSSAPFRLEVGAFLQSLDNGYGTWRGGEARLMWTSPRVTPFAYAATQSRDIPSGTTSQPSVGLGTYVTFTPGLSAIASASAAPRRDVELYPRSRLDAALIAAVPGVRGLLITGGITELRFAGDAGGRILSTGPILYVGHGIYSIVARFNHDRLSGANSKSFLAAGQYGTQGNYWIGGSLGGGNEAYQVLAATPFDARFESRGASAFLQKWVAHHQGFTLRYDFEHKLKTYHRNGVTASYFIEW